MKPTIEEAKNYVVGHFAKQALKVEILSAVENEEYNGDVIDVRFIIESEERTIGEPGYIMSVWYEAGATGPYLYGEW